MVEASKTIAKQSQSSKNLSKNTVKKLERPRQGTLLPKSTLYAKDYRFQVD